MTLYEFDDMSYDTTYNIQHADVMCVQATAAQHDNSISNNRRQQHDNNNNNMLYMSHNMLLLLACCTRGSWFEHTPMSMTKNFTS